MPKKNKNDKNKSSASAMKMLRMAQNKTDTPAVLKKHVSDINSLKTRKWVEEIEL